MAGFNVTRTDYQRKSHWRTVQSHGARDHLGNNY